ncbi:MAG TPA: ABC transporter substrate-binding protein [Candidatus Binatia bacterium]|nr:ABC transporter substrate-binding protein [Candidatus Binatia bacterium]
MDKIKFPYRSSSHLPMLHVVAESGSWEKYGLEVEYDKRISSRDAHAGVLSGDVEFVGGNHVSPYGHRARGDSWVYLAQTVNVVPGRVLAVRADSGINGIADLRGKKVGTRGSHPGLNDWLELKQHGLDVDRDDVELISQLEDSIDPVNPNAEDEDDPLWYWLRDRHVDAVFLDSAERFIAEKEPILKTIELRTFPMIYFTTVSTSLRFAEKHPDIVERFLKGMIEGIHFFKTQPERTARIIKERYDKLGTLDDDVVRATQATLADALEPKLIPSMAAIANVYEEGVRQDKEAKRVNPLALWDMHFIRQIDDSGFIENLYKDSRRAEV